MNIGALPELILAWLQNQGTDLLQPDKSPAEGQFMPGQQYDATVLANLPNGRSIVQVGDQKLDMALPQQAKAGEVLNLTYVQSGPRPTFVLNTQAAGAPQPVTVSQAAQQVSALNRYVPVESVSAAPSVSPTVSAAVQTNAMPDAAAKPIVSNPALLLAPASGSAAALATGAIPTLSSLAIPALPSVAITDEAVTGLQNALAADTSAATVKEVAVPKAPTDSMLPVRLQQTVKESGLFYESHLDKWVRGQVGLDSILREPQAKLAQTPGPLLDLPDLEGMPEKAANIAARQLNMIEGGPFVWQGQVWPGQHMEWQVAERDARRQDGEIEPQKWHSSLQLTLPRLGGIGANLDVGALGLRVGLKAQSPETEREMKAALPELIQRLKDAGLNVGSIQVESADGSAT